MAGTFEGLGVPLYGSFTLGNESQTTILTVDTAGMWNWAYDAPGADNNLAVTVTDSSTVTSGYLQAYYASVTTSGSYTTGSTQINAIAVDLTLGGTVGCEAEAAYFYIAGTGTPTLSSGNINGMQIYIDDLGAAPSSRSAIQLHIADGNTASGQDAFIVCRLEGSSGAVTNLVQLAGTAASKPDYFLATNGLAGFITAGDFLTSAATAYGFKVNLNGTDAYIPIVTDS